MTFPPTSVRNCNPSKLEIAPVRFLIMRFPVTLVNLALLKLSPLSALIYVTKKPSIVRFPSTIDWFQKAVGSVVMVTSCALV